MRMQLAIVWATGCLATVMTARAIPAPAEVAVVYNSAVPESKDLAEYYCAKRKIPVKQMVGLDMPLTADISREQFNDSILVPLRAEFDKREWWDRGKGPDGLTMPLRNRIRVMALMKGVPLRIQPTPKPKPAEGEEAKNPAPQGNPMAGHDEASVDSELAMFGVEGLPTEAVLVNKYHKSDRGIDKANLPFMVLTGRIDASSYAICKRMINDAADAEVTGLWGMALVDVANKFPMGDAWLEGVAAECQARGIPTLVDRFNDTLPMNWPARDVAVYYGWYDWNVSGPFRNPAFRFRKGAVAVHLHSYSAQQLTNAGKNWCAPLLAKGAAATVGNVHEPYLHLTHDLAILQTSLLGGDTLVEAAWKAMPVTSWQGVVLGDPLYRPYRHFNGTGTVTEDDRAYRALRAAVMQWPGDMDTQLSQIDKAALRMNSGVLMEAQGLSLLARKRDAEAAAKFRLAKGLYTLKTDRLRMALLRAAIDRAGGKKELAVKELRDAVSRFRALPESKAADAWLDILDPPPPPPANPNSVPAKSGAAPAKKN